MTVAAPSTRPPGRRSTRTLRPCGRCTCATSSPPIRAVRSGSRARRRGSSSTSRRTASPTRRCCDSLRSREQAGVAERRDAMFAGERINVTEDRSVLHVALRMPRGRSLVVDGVDVVAEVHEVLDRMGAFADAVRSGEWKGATGRPIKNVVNIGIGGSDLGPVMAYRALRHYSPPRHDLPLRLERRRHRLRRGDPRSRSCRDAVHRLLEDVHDARDDDQRDDGARLAPRRARRRRVGDRPALRRRLDEPRGRGGVRDRHRQRVRVLGLGRRALLDGLRDRPLDDARDRA